MLELGDSDALLGKCHPVLGGGSERTRPGEMLSESWERGAEPPQGSGSRKDVTSALAICTVLAQQTPLDVCSQFKG